LSRDPTFDTLVSRIASTHEEAVVNCKLPFEVVLRTLQPERDPSRSPLFQVTFGYQLKAQPEPKFADLGASSIDIILPVSHYDLSLLVAEVGESLVLNFDYNPDLFDRASVERIAAHYQHLLKGIAEKQSEPVSRMPLLTPGERHQLVVTWNETRADYPHDTCLHELIEAQAASSPELTAYTFQSRSLTYKQVNQKANQLAACLRDKGIGKGDFVPVLMDRSLELPLALLAVMKAGAAFVPLEVHWPVERIQHIVNDTASKLLLVNRDTPVFADLHVNERMLVDETELTASVSNLNVDMRSDDRIYTIYTSGSTGTPKGAVNRHRGIVNRLAYMTRRYGCTPQDVILQTSAHIYDAAVWQFFWPLINGARTVIPSPMIGFDFHHVFDLIEREGVTVTDFVPSVFNILVDYLVKDESLRPKLASIRQILIGGEALNPKTIFQYKSFFPRTGITNTYGPTETSIGVIFYEVGDDYIDPLPIGRPIDNVNAYILDRHLNPAPVGIPGHLYIGGDCVGLGYLNDPQKTAAVFIDNPFTESGTGKIYRTGDLARYRPDGNIEFLGRADHQVKIRGVRMELGEIEAAIGRHQDVREAVVMVREDVPGDKRLVAYYIPDTEPAPSGSQLRTALKQKLPEYMIPHTFVQLDAFPLTSSGKLNRRGLPKPEYGHTEGDETFVAPRTETEITLAGIWEEVLGLERVGLHDNFYEIGGDSLSAMKVLAEVKEKLGIFLDAEQLLFENLAQFASSCSGQVITNDSNDQVQRNDTGETVEALFIGHGERRLYGCYHIPKVAGTRKGAVLCYPIGHEYIRAHRSYRLLAKQLAEAGIHVLRFDYSGTGDSGGEFNRARVGHWIDDINTAVDDIRNRFDVTLAYLIGLRLGGSLALQAAAKDAHISGLVLWDPVVNGRMYLSETLAIHNDMLRSSGHRVRRKQRGNARPKELIGFPISPALYGDLQSLELDVSNGADASHILLVQSDENVAAHESQERLSQRGFNVDYRKVPSPQIWAGDPYKTLLPYKILQTVVTWITQQNQ
jgi:amino acid adenylation domain-containing protein